MLVIVSVSMHNEQRCIDFVAVADSNRQASCVCITAMAWSGNTQRVLDASMPTPRQRVRNFFGMKSALQCPLRWHGRGRQQFSRRDGNKGRGPHAEASSKSFVKRRVRSLFFSNSAALGGIICFSFSPPQHWRTRPHCEAADSQEGCTAPRKTLAQRRCRRERGSAKPPRAEHVQEA